MKKNGKNNGNPFKDMPNVHVVQIDNEQNRKQAEQAKKQAMYLDFWESMTENEYIETVKMINSNQIDSDNQLFKDKDLLEFVKMKIKQGKEQADQESKTFFELLPQMSATVQKSMLEFINEHFTDEQTHIDYVNLVQMARERAVTEHQQETAKQAELQADLAELAELRAEQEAEAKLAEEELARLERLGDLIEENLRNEELEEEETDRLEKEFFAGYAQENTEVETEVETEIMKTPEVVSEVQKEILTQTPTTEIMQTEKVVSETVATATTVNNTQNVVNQQVTNIIVEQKPIFKMSIADKIAEANKMLAIAHKKEQTENLLKDFYGYLNAKKDGDNFTLQSADKMYKFSTPNQELVDEVNNVLEKFLKNKISSFEMQLQNFQLA